MKGDAQVAREHRASGRNVRVRECVLVRAGGQNRGYRYIILFVHPDRFPFEGNRILPIAPLTAFASE